MRALVSIVCLLVLYGQEQLSMALSTSSDRKKLGLKKNSRRELLVQSSAGIVGVLSTAANAATTADWLKEVPVESLDQAASRFDIREEEYQETKEKSSEIFERAKERALVAKPKKSQKATESVRFGVRVAREDGTFAVRDDDPDPPTLGDIRIAVFGEAAPANAALFLEFAARQDELAYSRSLIDQISENSAVAIGGRVRGLEDKTLFGEKILIYADREVLNTKTDRQLLSIAKNEYTQFSHDQAGLLTRKIISDDPRDLVAFGITLKAQPELDASWTVIGKVVDDPAGIVPKIASLPLYQSGEARTDSQLAASVFRSEYDTFRSVATAVGDSRVSNVFPGKILRRVEITRSSVSNR